MTIFDTTAIAMESISRNKGRAFLTMLGIIIGVGSVVLLTSIGTGIQKYIEDQFESLGTNVVYVVPGNPFGEDGGIADPERSAIEQTQETLKEPMIGQLKRQLRSEITTAIPMTVFVGTAKYQDETKRVSFMGTYEEYEKVLTSEAVKGRWFTKAERDGDKRVAFLGHKIAEELFGTVDPVNKRIRVNDITFQVVGVMEEKGGGGFGGPSFDNYIYIPFGTGTKIFDTKAINQIAIQVRDRDRIPEVIEMIEIEIGKDLEDDEFSVFDQSTILETINSILGVLTAGLGGIAAISLVVGGIGIMNIMLVTVTERTKEIGLRKALGATPNQILLQFLIESATLSVIGGMIGVVIAFLGSLIIQQFFPATVTIQAVILAFSVSAIVGIIFGSAPARKASKLSPIEALRAE